MRCDCFPKLLLWLLLLVVMAKQLLNFNRNHNHESKMDHQRRDIFSRRRELLEAGCSALVRDKTLRSSYIEPANFLTINR